MHAHKDSNLEYRGREFSDRATKPLWVLFFKRIKGKKNEVGSVEILESKNIHNWST